MASMSVFQVIQKHKVPYVALMMILYAISLIIVTVGFFSPSWIKSSASDIDCENGIGLVTGSCQFHSFDTSPHHLGYHLKVAFGLMLTALCILYVSLVFLILAVVFKFDRYEVFMSFMGIVSGALYPAAAIIVFVAWSYTMGVYPSHKTPTVYLTMCADNLMFIVYVMMRSYDNIFKKD